MTMRIRCAMAALLTLVAACGSGSGSGSGGTVGEARSSLKRVSYEASEASAGAQSVDALGLALLHANAGTANGNVALSPWSITVALAMARAGAKGATAAEMDAVLHSTDAAALDQALNALDQELAHRNGSFDAPDGSGKLHVEMSAANRAFVQQGFDLEQPFLDTLASRYGVGVGLVDYKTAAEKARSEINGFVSQQTHERIEELIPKGKLTDLTRLVLVNAVYLDAEWAVPFQKQATVDGTFHAPDADVQVPLMHSHDGHRFAEGDGWKGAELEYAGGQLAMMLVLPDAGRFDEIAANVDTSVLDAIAAAPADVLMLTLPKLHVHKSLGLKEQLEALGMPAAFDPDHADFSGISAKEPLVLADVLHQADVAVDEVGTVAAAATADIFEQAGARVSPPELVVDRPFLFFVRDKATGAILFAGQVTDPSA